jgi:hypothetical protein
LLGLLGRDGSDPEKDGQDETSCGATDGAKARSNTERRSKHGTYSFEELTVKRSLPPPNWYWTRWKIVCPECQFLKAYGRAA